MSFPTPIFPANRPPLPEVRSDAASTPAARPAAPVDEGFLEGAVRRGREFAAELKSPEQAVPWIVIATLGVMLIYSYWPGLLNARSSWDNPQYQHGWIVPLFTVMLLFWWRQPVGVVTPSARAAGMGLLAASFILRLFCANFRIVTIDMYTFVPALIGVFLLAGGWSMFRWSWAPIATLIFMYPLPDEATRYLLGPLQTLATILSTYALQTIGLDAYRDGNRIILGDGQVLGVVDACSGLKMLTIFVWLAAMLMLVGGLEWWENLVIACSAIPIALVCNAFRITIAGILYNFQSSLTGVSATLESVGLIEKGHSLAESFHDSLPAALFMMVLAVGFLVLEMKILSILVVTEDATPTMIAPIGGGPGRLAGPEGLTTGRRPGTTGSPAQGSGFSAISRADSGETRRDSRSPDDGQPLG